MLDTYATLAIILFFTGLAILVAEVFLPSGGVLAILTTLCLSGSLVCGYAAWFYQSPLVFWGFCGLQLFSIPAVLVGTFSLLPYTPFGKRALLEAPEPEDVEPYSKESARLQSLVGLQGTALTMLNPGGLVSVNDERHHAFSEGAMLEAGTAIEVLEIHGMRLLVRASISSTSASPETDAPLAGVRPFDFEVPEE